MEPTLGNYNMKPVKTIGESLMSALHGPAPTEEQKQYGVIREPELGESGYSGMDYDANAQAFNLPRKGDTFWQGLAKVMMAGGLIGGMGKGGINPEEEPIPVSNPKDLERNVDIGRQAQVEAQQVGNKLERNPDMNWENPEAASTLVLGHNMGTEAVRTGERMDPRILEGSLDQLQARIDDSTRQALVNPRVQIDKFNLNSGKGVRPQDFSKHLREADDVASSLGPVADYAKELIERLRENK